MSPRDALTSHPTETYAKLETVRARSFDILHEQPWRVPNGQAISNDVETHATLLTVLEATHGMEWHSTTDPTALHAGANVTLITHRALEVCAAFVNQVVVDTVVTVKHCLGDPDGAHDVGPPASVHAAESTGFLRDRGAQLALEPLGIDSSLRPTW